MNRLPMLGRGRPGQQPMRQAMTPAETTRRQEMAALLLGPGQNGGQPITNWAEGANALAEGFIGGRMRRQADAALQQGQQQRAAGIGAAVGAPVQVPSQSGQRLGFGIGRFMGNK